jgi:hypothetical protein
MEMCYDDSTCGGGPEKYKTFSVGTSLDGQDIGGFLTIPNDTIKDYKAATSSEQAYCIYIELESGGYACASNKGTAVTSTAPTPDNCCGMTLP